MTKILDEPFNTLTAWAVSGAALGTGRTGNGAATSSTAGITYTIAAGSRAATYTIGFALRITDLSAQRNVLLILSDAGVLTNVTVRVNTNGSVEALRGTSASLGVTAAGVVAVNTWAYLEVGFTFGNVPTGAITVRVNNTVVIGPLTGIDTNNGSALTVCDTIRLAGVSCTFDDFYLSTGDPFEGDHTIGLAATTSVTFAGSATGTSAVEGTGSATLTFTGSASGTVISGLVATTTLAFTVAGTGLKVLEADAGAQVSFRAFHPRRATVRQFGTWARSGTIPVDLVSTEFTPTAGALLVVLYAFKVEGVEEYLSGSLTGGAWWATGGNVAGAVSDTFANHSPWRSYMGNNHTTLGMTPQASWLTGVAYTKVGATPGPGKVTIAPRPLTAHPQYARMTVLEVRNWWSGNPLADWTSPGVFLGGFYETHHFPDDGQQTVRAAELSAVDENAVTVGIVLSDDADPAGAATDPQWWRGIDQTSAAFGTSGATVRSALFRMGENDAEAIDTTSSRYQWSALPEGGWLHLAAYMRIPEDVDTPAPVPRPFPETIVEFMDETGAWVDITCDVRTIDIDSGRQDIIEQFRAATCTCVMANFTGVYSPWPPYSIWDQAGRYRTDVPFRVNMGTEDITGGEVVLQLHHLFTGTTDAINDSWPGAGHDALVTVTASDGFKKLARFEAVAPDDSTTTACETTGAQVNRWADAAGWSWPRAVDTGVAWVHANPLDGDAIRGMQDLAVAEGLGAVYVRADGTLAFRSRTAAVTDPRMLDVQATFTDRDGDPYGSCYSDVRPAVDETQVYNVAHVGTRDAPMQHYSDADSLDWFGPRSYGPLTTELCEWNDDLAVAILTVYTHAHNERRVDEIVIRPDHHRNDIRWDTACNLQLLDRVRVVRHFPGGYTLDEDLIVQGISHHMEGGGLGMIPRAWEVTYRTAAALDAALFCRWDSGEWDECQWSI